MRFQVLTLAVAVAGTGCIGCTSVALQRYAAGQIQSAADYRAEAALHCLAVVAANPGTLPSFATLADGSTSVKDTASLSATTLWTRAAAGFATQALAPMVARSPNQLWTVDPVADHTRLEALRCACRWVLYGPERSCADCPGILADPREDATPGPHFGVAKRLARIPPGWLHVGGLKDVPVSACWKAHCGHTWVWVMPEGRASFAEFILVLHDIATIDVDFGATTTPPVLVTLVRARALPPAFKVTLDTIASLRKEKVDEKVLGPEKLGKLVGQGPYSQKEFLAKLKEALGEDMFKSVQQTVLKAAQVANLPYSKQLNYTDIRIIEPDFLAEMKRRIQDATASGKMVAITWDEWMTHTKPYHGTRSNVKPDGLQPVPRTVPTRALILELPELLVNPEGIRIGPIFPRSVAPAAAP